MSPRQTGRSLVKTTQGDNPIPRCLSIPDACEPEVVLMRAMLAARSFTATSCMGSVRNSRSTPWICGLPIRCLQTADIIQHEAALSTRYESPRAAAATHLGPFLRQESPVWVTG